ncbi:MAG: hypothetical protein ACF8QF_00130 [Phycisphaerales bacterium]
MRTRRFLALAGAASCALAITAAPAVAAPPVARAGATTPMPAATSPEQVVERLASALANGQLQHAWDCLPTSWQRDATSLVHEFGAKVDPDVWNRSFGLLRKGAFLMREQKDLILSMPNLRNDPRFNHAEASEAWDRVANLLDAIATSDLADTGSLRRLDIRAFLASSGGDFVTELRALGDIMPDMDTSAFDAFTNATATLVSQDGDTAVISVQVPGEGAHDVAMVRIEGKWLPADFASGWPGQMAEAHAALDQMTGDEFQQIKPQVMQLFAGLEMTLDQLALAETHEQFEQTAQMGVMQIFGAAMAVSAAQDR